MSEQPQFETNHPNNHQLLLSVPQRLNANTGLTGQGIVIAYLDAGFYMHHDIRKRVLLHVDATTNAINESNEIEHTDATSWHGLMVSAIGSGDGFASGGLYTSLAPESDIILIKVSNPRMQVKEKDILRGFVWLLENHHRYGIDIVNVSVGGDVVTDDPDHPLHQSVRALVDSGVTVVIAAGNHGAQRFVPPASSPEAIIVGGYNDNNSNNPDDWHAYHSNYGMAYDGTPKPDIIAPAHWIPSPILPKTIVEKEAKWLGGLLDRTDNSALKDLLKKGFKDLNLAQKKVEKPDEDLYRELQGRIYAHKLISKFYQHVDGTSVAAPIVSSAIAQLLQLNPMLTPAQIRDILKETARPLTTISGEQQGAGCLDINHAVAHVRQSPSYSMK